MVTTFNRFTFPTFGLYIALALLVAGALTLYRRPRDASIGATLDVLLGAVLLGWAGARVEYVLLNRALFTSWADVWTMRTGGLDWHGAVIGGLLGLWIAARVRRVPFGPLLTTLTPALPLIAFAAWRAAGRIGLAYGAEVATLADYPAWLVVEGPDIFGVMAPRYDTWAFGAGLAWVLWLWTAWRVWRPSDAAHFWRVLTVFSAGMFAVGFLRGDVAPVWGGLRADGWLDLVLFVVAGYSVARVASSSGDSMRS